MFDYIYSNIIRLIPEEVLRLPGLDFSSPVNLNTGELISYNRDRKLNSPIQPKVVKRAELGPLILKVTNDKHINLEGSLHEYHHENNFSEFTFPEIVTAINRIENKIQTSSENIILHNLEFGVNISLPFPVSVFLEGILSFKGQEPDKQSYEGKGNMRKFHFQQYEVKFYDKGKQYHLNYPLLRFEIKVTRMNYLHEKGITIHTLKDLTRKDFHAKLKRLLHKVIQGLILTENGLNGKNLSLSEKRLYKNANNPRYWSELWKLNQSQYRKRAPKFRELIEREGPDKIITTITELVSSTWDKLSLSKNGTEITTPNGTEITNGENPDRYGNNTYTKQLDSYLSESSTPPRFCKSCGRDISGQHPRSLFCSESRYGKEGKKCRNLDSNPRNNFRKRERIKKERGLLFDIGPYLINDELRKFAC